MLRLQNTDGFRQKQSAAIAGFGRMPAIAPRAFVLSDDDFDDVLSFLRRRPIHTVVMMSFIKDNGLVSEHNRGKFYGYRRADGELEGVALIGHTTLVEARSQSALQAFAAAAKKSETPIKMMMSDGRNIELFWQYFSGGTRQPRLVCEEKLFELNFPFFVKPSNWQIRLAAETELEQVAQAHAEVAFAESGVDPLETDREGFLRRTLRRIRQQRTFVVFEGGQLVFKADIAAQSADVIYLEGIYVAEKYRGRGIGAECLSKLAQTLLQQALHICLLSNMEFKAAHRSFQKAGFKSDDRCTTLFV
jgi:uncharacterized protein